jgi:peptide/nickel transport system permease protein
MSEALDTLLLERAAATRTRWLGSWELVAGTLVVALAVLAALLAPWLAPHDPTLQDVGQRLLAPGAGHWLGTDGLGRDILSRLVWGARPTLGLVLLVAGLSVPVGVAAGIIAGYFGGWADRVLMAVADAVMAFPRLVLALALVAVAGPGLVNGALALALTGWPAYARLARAETRVVRRADYLAAAEMQGIVGARLLWGHVLPCCLPTLEVRLALDLAGIILAAAGLGFLGLGIRPPAPEWGAMIADGSKVIFDEWWVAASPGAAILLLSLAFNLVADGLRDAGDPRHG